MEVKIGVKVEGARNCFEDFGDAPRHLFVDCTEGFAVGEGVRWAEASLASNEAKVVASLEPDYGELLKAVRRVGYDVYREAVYISVPGARPETPPRRCCMWSTTRWR